MVGLLQEAYPDAQPVVGTSLMHSQSPSLLWCPKGAHGSVRVPRRGAHAARESQGDVWAEPRGVGRGQFSGGRRSEGSGNTSLKRTEEFPWWLSDNKPLIQEDMGSIPGLAQWVKDLVLL